MAARQQAGQRELERLFLADDDASELLQERGEPGGNGTLTAAERTVISRACVLRGKRRLYPNALDTRQYRQARGKLRSAGSLVCDHVAGDASAPVRCAAPTLPRNTDRPPDADRLHHPSVVPAARDGAASSGVPGAPHGDRRPADRHRARRPSRAPHGAGRDPRAARARAQRGLHRPDRGTPRRPRACTTSIRTPRCARIR